VGLIALADRPKHDAADTIGRLRRMAIRAMLLSGDNRRTAEAIAGELGIDEVLAELLPDEKAERVRIL
jgi:Cu+-exporting ATPase